MIKVHGADVEFLKFNAGEPHVKVTNIKPEVFIDWKFENFEEFAYVALICDVLCRNPVKHVSLGVLYVPFARQDRATTENQPFALEVFCSMLKTLKINILTVADPHSQVFLDLMKDSNFELEIEDQAECYMCSTYPGYYHYDCVIAPDRGAVDKAEKIAKYVERKPLVTATKTRDPSTGALSNPQIDFGDLEVKRVIIVDDILDFGGTFVQLARAIKEQKPDVKLDLYVTHGLFGGGIEKYKGLFENIYCYNIMNKEIKSGDLLNLSGLS